MEETLSTCTKLQSNMVETPLHMCISHKRHDVRGAKTFLQQKCKLLFIPIIRTFDKTTYVHKFIMSIHHVQV